MNWLQVKNSNDLRDCAVEIFNSLGYTVELMGNRYVIRNNDVYMYLQNFRYMKYQGDFDIVVKLKEDRTFNKVFSRHITCVDISDMHKIIYAFLKEFEKNNLLNKLNDKRESKVIEGLENIAKSLLDIPTLETRKSDSLDFYDISVWRLKEALKAAYDLGLNNRK